ncbi:MAG: NAD(P)/FAD-dependent oxidoreductase [Caulobacteraceae bacterium]
MSAEAPAAHALVVGGGPAGAALAVLLARAGRRVILVEREAGAHDKVCGEFISGEAAGYLERLGLDIGRLGAVAIHKVRLAAGRSEAEHALPFPAFSLSRRRLDEALLGLAGDAGVELRRGRRVRSLDRQDGGWRGSIDGGEQIDAQAAFLATGKHDLKGRRRPPGLHGDLVGFKMRLCLAPAQAAALDGTVELHLLPGGYAGLEQIEEGLANLCLVIGRRRLDGGSGWNGLLQALLTDCPLLAERLAGGQSLWPKPLAISAIPYGHVAKPGGDLWRLGDQAAVIPSFAGDGLGIALHSAHAAAAAYLAGETTAAFQRRLAGELGPRVKGAALLSRLIVRPWAQGATVGLTRLRPQLLSAAAAWTRIPEKALQRLRPGPVRPGTAGSIPPSGRRSDCPA